MSNETSQIQRDIKALILRRQGLVQVLGKIKFNQDKGASCNHASFDQIKSEFLQQVERGGCQNYREVLQLMGLIRFR